jgi:hypothetical protein
MEKNVDDHTDPLSTACPHVDGPGAATSVVRAAGRRP